MKTFVHVDIVEVTDSSSVTPTILHQLKPLATSKLPVVFLLSPIDCPNPQKGAKTGSSTQKLQNFYGKF